MRQINARFSSSNRAGSPRRSPGPNTRYVSMKSHTWPPRLGYGSSSTGGIIISAIASLHRPKQLPRVRYAAVSRRRLGCLRPPPACGLFALLHFPLEPRAIHRREPEARLLEANLGHQLRVVRLVEPVDQDRK